MGKHRSIKTDIWSDTYFEELKTNEKLAFFYLITNEKTNMLGIYEASYKKIAFETGIIKADVERIMKKFVKDKKVTIKGKYIIINNFLLHQKFNTNMKKSAIDVWNNLSADITEGCKCLNKKNIEKDWGTLLNHIERLSKGLVILSKIEVEDEEEVEDEIESEIEIESEGEEEQPKPPKPKIEFIELGEFENIKIEKDNLEKLKESYSVVEIDWMIQRLGAWLVNKKKKVESYRSLKAYFVSWVYRSYEEEKQKQSQNKDKYKGYNDAMETLNVFLGIDETENQTEPATEDTDYTTL